MYNIPVSKETRRQSDQRYYLPDFDALLKLAAEQPEELERLRKGLCEQVINDAPAPMRARLEGLQFRIDAERQLSRSPMGACIKISRMMREALADLTQALVNPGDSHKQQQSTKATVLHFGR